MASSQIDPARLSGDALSRWYLRSPADIEQERQTGAAQRYDDFFSPLDDSTRFGTKPAIDTDEPDSSSSPAVLRTANDNQSSSGAGFGSQRLFWVKPNTDTSYQLASASSRRFGDYWSVPGCANCHGYTPTTLPPVRGNFPFPPNYSPRSGGRDGAPFSDRRWSERPQCHQQFETDRKICQRARNSQCWETSNKRLGVCDRTGHLNTPPLGFGPAGR